MLSFLQTSRHRLQTRIHIRSLSLSSDSIAKFINRTTALEKENRWTDISEALTNADNKVDIIQHTFNMCAENIQSIQSQTKTNKVWQTHQSSLPPCTFQTLLDASVAAKNLDQLTVLLNATNSDVRVASVIGVNGLFDYYKPFLTATANDCNTATSDNSAAFVEGLGGGGGKPNAFVTEIESRIMGHFFNWTVHMDNESTREQSQLLFNNMHFLHQDNWSGMLGFIDTVTNSSSVENSVSLSTYDFLASIDGVRATSFSLAAYEFLAAHDIAKATVFLNNAKQKGQFAPSCLTVSGQYSDLVWKSIPLAWPTADSTDSDSVTPTVARKENNHKRHSSFKRQSPTFTPGSVEVDIALAEYLNNSVGTPSRTSSGTLNLQQSEEKKSLDLACIKNNLDNLFYLAEGSTEFDKQLRYCFYKNLLNCNRPRTLLSYEAQRRAQERQYYTALTSGENNSGNARKGPPSLDVGGYKTVLKAYANQLDVEGMFGTLSDWNQTAHFISTLPSTDDPSSTSGEGNVFVTPDSRVYKVLISFFHMHPQMITASRLERLFEQMQLNNVTPDDTKDIIALFKFAHQAHSSVMANTLLDWVELMMRGDEDSSDNTRRDHFHPLFQSDSRSDLINRNSVPRKVFHKAELIQMYDFVLETNAMELDNGDKCLDILFAMKKNKIPLNGNRVAYVMKAFKNSKNFEALLELFHSMVKLGVNRDTYHVSLAVVAYLRTDQVGTGLSLLERFEAAGQDLKGFAYFAAAFEILRRLCVKPHFTPFLLNSKDAAGDPEFMQQNEATIKCIDLFLRAVKNEDMYPASKTHLRTSFRLLDNAIFEDMIQYLEQIDSSTSKPTQAPQDGCDASARPSSSPTPPLAPPATRLLKLFKELKKQGERYR